MVDLIVFLCVCVVFFPPERATDGGLQSEDWTLNMEICDIINETDEGWAMSRIRIINYYSRSSPGSLDLPWQLVTELSPSYCKKDGPGVWGE